MSVRQGACAVGRVYGQDIFAEISANPEFLEGIKWFDAAGVVGAAGFERSIAGDAAPAFVGFAFLGAAADGIVGRGIVIIAAFVPDEAFSEIEDKI